MSERLVSSRSVSAVRDRNRIVQIVTATHNTQVSNATNTRVDTGLTATITPRSASSKILVHIHQQDCAKDTNDTYGVLELHRGATNLFEISKFIGYTQSTATSNSGTISGIYEDSPATTNAVTYKTTIYSANNNARVYANANNGRSSMVLMEILP